MTGKDITNALKGKGYTIVSAAKALGITRQTMHNHLNRAVLDKDFLQSVKDKLKIEIGEIVQVARLDQREIQESLIAINAQLRVLFLKIVEIESRDPKTKLVKRSTTAVTLELEDLIRQETKRLLNELKLS